MKPAGRQNARFADNINSQVRPGAGARYTFGNAKDYRARRLTLAAWLLTVCGGVELTVGSGATRTVGSKPAGDDVLGDLSDGARTFTNPLRPNDPGSR